VFSVVFPNQRKRSEECMVGIKRCSKEKSNGYWDAKAVEKEIRAIFFGYTSPFRSSRIHGYYV